MKKDLKKQIKQQGYFFDEYILKLNEISKKKDLYDFNNVNEVIQIYSDYLKHHIIFDEKYYFKIKETFIDEYFKDNLNLFLKKWFIYIIDTVYYEMIGEQCLKIKEIIDK